MHTAREVLEDPMMEEIAASLAVCWTMDTMHTAREVLEDLMMEEIAASLMVMPPLAAQTTTSRADTPTEDGPLGFGSAKPVDADMFRTPTQDDHTVDISDSCATCRLKSFTRRVLKKVDSSLIPEPPK